MMRNKKGFSVIVVPILAVILLIIFTLLKVSGATNRTNTSLNIATNTGTGSNTTDEIVLNNLGFRLLVPHELFNELAFEENTTIAKLTTKEAMNSEPNCGLDDNNTPSLGILFKVEGYYPNDPNPMNTPGTLIKQFDEYYIAYRPAQQSCTSSSDLQEKINSYSEQLKASFSTIKEL